MARTQVLDPGSMLGPMKISLRHLAPLTVLLAFALFPLGWLTEFSALAHHVGGVLFPNELAHAIGHTLLFMTIAAALLRYFPALLGHPALFFTLVLAVAIGQEGFQLLYKQRGVVLNDLTDIGIDLMAAGMVFALWYSRARASAAPTRSPQSRATK